MISFHLLTFVVSALVLTMAGCNEPFSPKGPFVQRFVAYAVLDARSDTQYVRLSLSYNPPGYDPSVMTGAQYDTTAAVEVSTAGQTYIFQDTLLGPSLHAFVNSSFHPTPGTRYNLTASSSVGTITASSQVPASGNLSIANPSTLQYPSTFATGNIEVQGVLGSGARGFLVRFIFVYGLASDSTVQHEIEIPMSFEQNQDGVSTPVYPQMQRNTDSNPVVAFPVTNYLKIIADLTNQFATRILMKKARFYLVQVDESLYNYYNIANGFNDKYSIRTDQPDYTNIQNGYGVFGSFNVDSLIITY